MPIDLPDIPWVVLDIEAGGLFADDGARIGSVGLGAPGWSIALPFDQGVRDKMAQAQEVLWTDPDPNLPREDWDQLMDWLAGRGIVCHNAKYDLAMAEAGTREWPGRDLTANLHWCTLLAQRELDPVEEVGLDSTAVRLGLGEKVSNEPLKAWLKKHKYKTDRYDLAPWDLIRPYLLGDVDLTVRLFEMQSRRYAEGDADPDGMARQLELLKVLYAMEARGVGYDHETSQRVAGQLEARAAKLEATMPFECSPNAAKAWFFGKQGLLPDRRTDKGAPSLDEEQVREWALQGIEWAAEYADVSKMRRAVSMWYRGYPEKAGPDGRLRCYYKQAHVRSGRMSVQRVQLQAIPKADKALAGVPMVRELLRAEEGKGLWNIDLQQAELRVAAKYARCQTMLDMVLSGADFHSATTKRVLKVDESHPLWPEKRDIGKRLTFAAIFMVGGEKFQATLSKMSGVHLELEECNRYVREWRNLYPEFGHAYRRAERLFSNRGYVWLLPHTPYQVASYMGPRDYPNTAWNRVVQGSLAEFLRLWLVDVEKHWPGYMVLTVHDSIVLEAPLDEGDELARQVAERTARMATDLFRVEMKCDIKRWDR